MKIEIEISEEDYTVIKDHCEKYGITLSSFFQQFADDAIEGAVSAIQGLVDLREERLESDAS